MIRKLRKKVSREQKQQAVDDYLNGKKSAKELADELGVQQQVIYKWKTSFEENSKGVRVHELEDNGCPPEMAKRMSQLEDEVIEYQKKVAEQSLVIDLLKKLRQQGNLPPEKELNGLIATMKLLEQKKRPVK